MTDESEITINSQWWWEREGTIITVTGIEQHESGQTRIEVEYIYRDDLQSHFRTLFDYLSPQDWQEEVRPLDDQTICAFITEQLSDNDIDTWNAGCITSNIEQLMKIARVDCIQIYGSHDGPEPVSVNLC